MCAVCGMMFCSPDCPEYDPQNDPSFNGYCKKCGVALYGSEDGLCEDCAMEEKIDETMARD